MLRYATPALVPRGDAEGDGEAAGLAAGDARLLLLSLPPSLLSRRPRGENEPRPSADSFRARTSRSAPPAGAIRPFCA